MSAFSGDPRRDFDEATDEIIKLKDRIANYQEKITKLQGENKRLRNKMAEIEAKHGDAIAEKDAIIKELRNRLAHAEAINAHDRTNTGLPTGKTPERKKKVIPNSRRGEGLAKGGQPGHRKHSLNVQDGVGEAEIIEHRPDEEGFCCPGCGSEACTLTDRHETKYEYDVQIKVVRRKHVFYYYKCNDCGTEFRSVIPPNLKEEAQYGSGLQALALSLTNTVNAAMNKASMFLAGISGGTLKPCEGYIAKLQVRAAKGLRQFRLELRALLVTLRLIYWDDTVIFINMARACFRFYGDESIAYYTAHLHKDMASIDDDNILAALTPETRAMHDHNTLNYNEKFSFDNIECNQHLQRDCQKNTDDTGHAWSTDLKKLIGTTIKDRNDAIKTGEAAFEASYVAGFHRKLDTCLADGWMQTEKGEDKYGASFEHALLRRIQKYRRNYFLWVEDFSLPTTNNLSERGLRGIKSHMKISGQFESEEAADNHALIRTYIETCRRNGINEYSALQRLCDGNPYSVSEIFPNRR